MELEISPEPSPEERAAIAAALEREVESGPPAWQASALPPEDDAPRP